MKLGLETHSDSSQLLYKI